MVGQNDNSVWVSAKKVDGSVKKFKGRFLIGTDGARSIVRKSIGAKFDGMTIPEIFSSSFYKLSLQKKLFLI